MRELPKVKYLSGWQIIERWGIQKFQLVELIRKRLLTPIDQFGDISCRPDCIEQLRIEDKLNGTISDLFHKRSLRRKEGITKQEEIEFEIKIQEAEELRDSHYAKFDTDPYDWSYFYPNIYDPDSDQIIDAACDLFFDEREVALFDQGKKPKEDNAKTADATSKKNRKKQKPKLVTDEDLWAMIKGDFSPIDHLDNRPQESHAIDQEPQTIDLDELDEYKNFSSRDYYDEARAIRSKMKIDGLVEDHKKQRDSLNKSEVKRLVNLEDPYKGNIAVIVKLGLEIDRIYQAFKMAHGVTDNSINSRSDRKKAAISYFEENKDTFELLNENLISDPVLYKFKSSQTYRDYQTKLLKIGLESIFPGKRFSGHKAYFAFRKATDQ